MKFLDLIPPIFYSSSSPDNIYRIHILHFINPFENKFNQYQHEKLFYARFLLFLFLPCDILRIKHKKKPNEI